MKHIRRKAGLQGSGSVGWTNLKRLTVYVTDDTFAKVKGRAAALEVGNGVIARQIVEAWAKQEPMPIFIGVGEHS